MNTPAANTLYTSIRQLLSERVLSPDNQKRVTLLDVCCGTGTIGLAMADVRYLIQGVVIDQSLCSSSMTSSEWRCVQNQWRMPATIASTTVATHHRLTPLTILPTGINNARFLVGKAEDLLANLLLAEERIDGETERQFVAIVDPPRAGLRECYRDSVCH